MERASLWINEVSRAVGRALGQFVEYLPTVIGALVILAAGWRSCARSASGPPTG